MKYGIQGNDGAWYWPHSLLEAMPSLNEEEITDKEGKFETEDINLCFKYMQILINKYGYNPHNMEVKERQ